MALIDAKQLSSLRKEYGVSQTELAEYLGYVVNGKPNRSMIARFENGYAKINPRISKLIENFFMSHNVCEEDVE
mgnify:CR=1 FL=1|jgi:transcriptional regulator with XRE-family HTH domain|tara:strand:- start:731 stop:952 length:222 start_codon:yes stop_codon:yes gene_type:complete